MPDCPAAAVSRPPKEEEPNPWEGFVHSTKGHVDEVWNIAGKAWHSIKGCFTWDEKPINAQDKRPSQVTTTDPQTVRLPVSAEEKEEKKKELEYKEGFFHCAVAGVPGSGKSSLLNALRGLRNNEPRSAPTGIMEKTSVTIRYVDQDTAMHPQFAWYDIPGAGSLTVPEWTYFKDQGMYIFDAVIVLIDTRFTETDIAILRNCELYRIPAFIVRSKASQHIRNVVDDLARGEDESDSHIWERAREHFIRRTEENVRRNLERAQLPPMKVYIVDKEPMVQVVTDRDRSTETMPSGLIHEKELWHDLVKEADGSQLIK